MGCGLFGKLPAKRDFIALQAPSSFLSLYEPWLQGGLTASRLALGAGWQDAFLNAPIWRFWFGAALAGGAAVAGAFMPSVDGIGRYFPLTVFAVAGQGAAIPPPELDPQELWFEQAEAFLLQALEPEASYEAVAQRLEQLPPPADALAAPPADMVRLSDGSIVSALDPATFPARLAALRVEDHARAYAHSSYVWTVGGEDFEPLALVGQGLPSPYLFSGLMSGRFDAFLGAGAAR